MKLFGKLYEHHMIKTWVRDRPQGWHLASGAWSPFYFMFREVPSHPEIFKHSVAVLTSLVREKLTTAPVDMLIGVATTGIPLAAGVALELGLPCGFTRKVSGASDPQMLEAATKKWGDHSVVEGQFRNGMHYVLVDDVVTGGASKSVARAQVDLAAKQRGIELIFAGTVVVVDRGFPGHANADVIAGYRFYDAIDQITEFGGSTEEVNVIREYLVDPEKFQDPKFRTERCGPLTCSDKI